MARRESPAGAVCGTSTPFLGWDWRSEVSLDWVKVGCGVRFILITRLSFCRAGDAELAINAVFTVGTPAPCVSHSGVFMSSSEDESSSSTVKSVGLGDGVQPAHCSEDSRFGLAIPRLWNGARCKQSNSPELNASGQGLEDGQPAFLTSSPVGGEGAARGSRVRIRSQGVGSTGNGSTGVAQSTKVSNKRVTSY